MSFLVAIPAVLLLAILVMNGMAHGGKMFSGMMTVIVAVTGLTVLGLGLSPFAVMAFYPADGFASMPDSPATATPSSPPAGSDDDDEEQLEEVEDGFDDDGEDSDDGFEDTFDNDAGGEELYDDDGEDYGEDEWE
ncbi:MAG TPA: hypothetical protein EYG03_10085 [Planctomycetes bacterium]|nr:hypothetical protein [Fuerstiella sp.]HIK92314.1 hypothetical protein [Planctomycetota bacterium]